MFIGRYQKWAWLPLTVQCRGNLVSAAPTAAPAFSIYNAAGQKVMGPRTIPPKAPGKVTGFFELEQFLGSEFSDGNYTAHISYAVSGSNYADIRRFEIVPGGHNNGAYINIYSYERPHADYVVGQLDNDVLEFRKNPAASDG